MKKVLACGCFDILHIGHINHLKAAKKYGDYLVVAVTSDRFVNKGPGKPVFTAEVRAEMLRSLSFVDKVIISDYPTATPIIEKVKPDFYVKGPDYRDHTKDVTGEIANEEAAVKAHGGEIRYTNDETYSSSTLANRFFVTWTDDQQKIISKVKDLGGMDKINEILDRISRLSVVTVGEPILDTYRFCEPQGISSKYPSISAKFSYSESYEGGAWAIVNHLKGFVKHAELLIPDAFSIPRKIRYISTDKNQRIFEITYNTDNNYWANKKPGEFSHKMLSMCNSADLTILADFGHGLFEGPALEASSYIKSFKALNVQTNSSNAPFNPYTKHELFDYLSIDTREARVAFHDRTSKPLTLCRRIRTVSEKPISLTCGSNGAYFVRREANYFSPAFADNVVDATGAGDAYFAMTSMLVKVDCNPELIPFLGNVFAGLKTKIVGNKSSVTKAQFIKALTGILK